MDDLLHNPSFKNESDLSIVADDDEMKDKDLRDSIGF